MFCFDIFDMAFDKAEFKEDDHPRDKGGKFSKSSGGGGSSGKQSFGTLRAKHDYHFSSKSGSNITYSSGNKTLTFSGATGAWTAKVDGKTVAEGKGKKSVVDYLKKQQGGHETSAKSGIEKDLESEGFKVTSADDDTTIYKKDGVSVELNTQTGEWYLTKEGMFVAEGVGSEELGNAVGGLESGNPETKPEPKPEPPPEKKEEPKPASTASSPGAVAEAKGYNKVDEENGIVTYTKGVGQEIQVDLSTGQWLSKSVGHQTKLGVGAASLETLMNGGVAGENTYKSDLTAAKEEAEKETVNANASQTMKKLIDHAPKANSVQESAVSSYSGANYKTINNNLRENPDHTSSTIKAIDSWLEKAAFPEDVKLYRKVGGSYAKILMSVLVEGTKFVDHGYSSTSTHEGSWSGELKFVIEAKKGQRGAAIKHLSQHPNENEVLLPRGQKYVVNKIDRKKMVVHVSLGD